MNRSLLSLIPFVIFGACGPSGEGPTPTPTPNALGEDLTVTFLETPDASTEFAASWFEFPAPDAVSYLCALDDEEADACDTSTFLVPLEVGLHTFRVWALGSAGDVGDAATLTWTIEGMLYPDHPEMIATDQMPAPVDDGGWRGIFRINCDFSHSSYNDPVVFPLEEDGAHLHRFYGNMATDHTTTWPSLYALPESSCQGNTINGSSYWIPALLAPMYTEHPDCDENDPTDLDCRRDDFTPERVLDEHGDPAWEVVPAVVGNDDVAHEVFYYSGGVDDLDSVQNIPSGLRMVAGDGSTTPSDTPQGFGSVRWHCQSWFSSDAQGGPWSATIPECLEPDRLRMDILFPNCWDGENLDSADHQSHMAYPVTTGSGPSAVTECPSTHPVPLIRPSYHYAFPVLPGNSEPDTQSSKGWRLASDHYTVDDAEAGGLSLHGDWFNAWQPEVLQAVLENCIQGKLDCHDGNLANGLRLSGTAPGDQTLPEIVNGGLGTHL